MKFMRCLRPTSVSPFALCLGFVFLVFLPTAVLAQLIKMEVGQAGVNPGAGLFFIAKKENLFAKHGLDVNVISTSTPAAVQAMLGGSMQIATGAAAGAFVTATVEGSPPFVLVASWINVLPYSLMVQKDIQKPEDLKGKTGSAAGPFGAIPDIAQRFALAKMGIDPEKDVKLMQLGRPDNAHTVAQLEKGEVQFAPVPPPFDRIAEKRGLRRLMSLPDLGIPWQNNGEWVQRSYLKNNRENVLRFLRAIGDAMKVYFGQKEKTLAYLVEYMGSSREDTEYAYQMYTKWADRVPRPKVEGMRMVLDAIKKNTPKAASADPASFIDTSLVEQLAKEEYFK